MLDICMILVYIKLNMVVIGFDDCSNNEVGVW